MMDRAIVHTDLKIIIPKGCYGRIAARLLAISNNLWVSEANIRAFFLLTWSNNFSFVFSLLANKTIDSDFRGEMKVVLLNLDPHSPFMKR
jgi:dUTPase